MLLFGMALTSIGCDDDPLRFEAGDDGGANPDADADSDADADTDTDADADTDTDADSDADSDTDTDADTDTGFDCSALPASPLGFEIVEGPITGEDFAFDDAGNLIGMSQYSLFKSPRGGAPTLWVQNADCASGLRALPSGEIVCSNGANSLYLFGLDGARTTLLSNLQYPNGIEVDLDGFAYVSQQDAGVVTKVDPHTGETWTIATDLDAPNGLTFSPDYRTLYVGSFCGDGGMSGSGLGKIYEIPFDEAGNPGEWSVFLGLDAPAAIEASMTGCFDGMGVDICGNVYVNDYGITRVYRIAPDASTVETLVDLAAPSDWIPNMQWGAGVGGWDQNALYVADMGQNQVYEIPVGVPGKQRMYP